MAKVYPDLQSIIKNSSNEEDENKKAEVHLLKFLNDNLDDTYDIFYQPFLNVDRPDIVVPFHIISSWCILFLFFHYILCKFIPFLLCN